MNYKKEYRELVETVKKNLRTQDLPARNEDIARVLGYDRSYFSTLLGERGIVTEQHIKNLKLNYPFLLSNPTQRHQATRNNLKAIGESKNGIQVYETAPTYASMKTVYHDEHAVPDYVLNIPQFRDCNYGTRASGDSMYPEIRNGDLIVSKEIPIDARIIFGDIYIVHTRDGLETIKYINQYEEDKKAEKWVYLVPHNKAAGQGTPIPREEIIKLFKVRAIFKAY